MSVDEIRVEFPAESGGFGESKEAVAEVRSVGEHIPEDGIAFGVERLDIGAVGLAGEKVRGDLGFFVVAELDVEGRESDVAESSAR